VCNIQSIQNHDLVASNSRNTWDIIFSLSGERGGSSQRMKRGVEKGKGEVDAMMWREKRGREIGT